MSVNLVDKTTGDLTTIAGETLWADSPIGSILPYGGNTAPSGWFLCQGQALSRTTYSELFAVIGTAFGSGDGSTTFNLPDMRESVPKGAGLTGHTVGAHLDADGLAVGEFLDDRVQEHTHSVAYVDVTGSSAFTWGFANQKRLNAGSGITNNNSGRSGATTEVKSVGVNYIIKAKMVAMPSDFMSKVDEAVGEFLNHKSANITATFSGSATISKDVTFDTPMPDTNYVVTFEGTYGNEQVIYPMVVAKSVNGFTVKITKTDETTSGTYAIKYHAFRIA